MSYFQSSMGRSTDLSKEIDVDLEDIDIDFDRIIHIIEDETQTVLSLENLFVTPYLWAKFEFHLNQFENLETLCISGNELDERAAHVVAKLLHNNHGIKRLEMKNMNLLPSICRIIAPSFGDLYSIEELDLSMNPEMGSEGFTLICYHLSHVKNIKKFSLSYCSITFKGWEVFSSICLDHFYSLEHIDLSNNVQLSSASSGEEKGGFFQLFSVLCKLKHVQTINLSGTPIFEQEEISPKINIKEGFQGMNAHSILLNRTMLDPRTCSYLSCLLEGCTNLQTLELNENYIQDEGCLNLFPYAMMYVEQGTDGIPISIKDISRKSGASPSSLSARST
ncbi:Major facilitator superfamily like protein, partial [Aduncisulcus paluster]